MPGTPINQANSGIDKLQADKKADDHQERQELPYNPPTVVRELTQTDRLNKQLLESVLERMTKSGELDKIVDTRELDQSDDNRDNYF